MTRVECLVRCMKCDVTVGKVFASTKDNDYVWHNKPVPNPMPKFCKLCNSVLQRVEP